MQIMANIRTNRSGNANQPGMAALVIYVVDIRIPISCMFLLLILRPYDILTSWTLSSACCLPLTGGVFFLKKNNQPRKYKITNYISLNYNDLLSIENNGKRRALQQIQQENILGTCSAHFDTIKSRKITKMWGSWVMMAPMVGAMPESHAILAVREKWVVSGIHT